MDTLRLRGTDRQTCAAAGAALLLATVLLLIATAEPAVGRAGTRDQDRDRPTGRLSEAAGTAPVGSPQSQMQTAWHSSPVTPIENIGSFQEDARFRIRQDSTHTILADSVSEFSGVQGHDNWYYGYYVSPFAGSTFEQMGEFNGTTWTIRRGQDGYWTTLWDTGGHPNGVRTSGGRRPIEHWAVRRWVSDVDGQVLIHGLVAKSNTGGGDGITGHIMVDGVEVWAQSVAGTDGIGIEYGIMTTVHSGSTVDFAISPGPSDIQDGTMFAAVIRRPAPPAFGAVAANSASEFSGTQGRDNWYYGYYVSPFTSSTFEQMGEFDGPTWAIRKGRGGYWTALWALGGHPNGVRTGGGRQAIEHWAVRRWISEVTGHITLSGTLAKQNYRYANRDGITGHILVDGTEVWAQHITGGDRFGVDYSVAVDVNLNSVVDFALSPGPSDWSDGSIFTTVIRSSSVDTTPPAAITDLAGTTGCAPGTVVLDWTAPGDNGDVGTAADYTVRYAGDPITSEFGWLLATDVDGEPAPQPAGTHQGMMVSGLTPGRSYHFAIVARDAAEHEGSLSNSPGATAGASGSTCSISGRVADADGHPISGVTVSGGQRRTATTDDDGHYTLVGLGLGTYTITPRKCGYSFIPPQRDVVVPPTAAEQHFRAVPISGSTDDLTIEHVEVTQALQTLSNTVPLVQGKPTWVRVHVKNTPGTVGGVTGRLQGYSLTDNARLRPALQPSNGPIVARPTGSDRGDFDQTLNFELPPSWLKGIVNITAEINPDGAVLETNCSNNTDAWTLEFVPTDPLTVTVYRIRYLENQPPTRDDAEATASLTRKVYPLNTDKLILNTLPDNEIIGFNTPLTSSNAWSRLLDRVAQRCAGSQRCYGLLPDVPTSPYWGIAYIGGNAAAGRAYKPQIMAHELAHTLGRKHIAGCGGDKPYDQETTQCMIGEYGFDTTWQEIYPRTSYDFMTYLGLDDGQWVSPLNYQRIYEALRLSTEGWQISEDVGGLQDYLILAGIIEADGSATLFPAYRRTWPTGTDDESGNGEYSIEVQDSHGEVLFVRHFDPGGLAEGTEDGSTGYFFQRVPLAAAVNRVLLKKGEITLKAMERSPNPPQLEILAPAGSQRLEGEVAIRWTASDADGDSLSYAVEYSRDGGSTWSVIDVHLEETNI